MDTRQLEMFLAVAENLSFTRASLQLHVVGSAISRQIRMLEEELGTEVFKRVNKKIYLTPAGETLIRYSRKIFEDLRNASLEISDIADLRSGHVRLGTVMLASVYLLPSVLERFKQRYPGVFITVVTGSSERLLSGVRDSSLDLGVLTLPVTAPDLAIVPFYVEDLVVVSGTTHPVLSKKRSISSVDLAKYPLILFPRGSYTRRIIEEAFDRLGVTLQHAMEVDNIVSIKPLVRRNLGIAIMPLPAIAEDVKRGDLHCLKIQDCELTRKLGLVTQRLRYLPKVVSELSRLFTT